ERQELQKAKSSHKLCRVLTADTPRLRITAPRRAPRCVGRCQGTQAWDTSAANSNPGASSQVTQTQQARADAPPGAGNTGTPRRQPWSPLSAGSRRMTGMG